jgi:hypothetical protein
MRMFKNISVSTSIPPRGSRKGALASIGVAVMLLGGGCAQGNADGTGRALKWGVERQLGPKTIRLATTSESCSLKPQPLEQPIIDYEGKRVYIELRQAPEEHRSGCFLGLFGVHKDITLERSLDSVMLFDSSTDPPARRWPRPIPLPRGN